MRLYEKENETTHFELFGTPDEKGAVSGPFKAHYLPQLALHLEDNEGKLEESNKSKFFQVGKDIKVQDLKWRGIFKTVPRSIIDSSQTLSKASKMEMFNVLMPLFQQPPELMAKACEQIVKLNEEDPETWLPESFLAYLKQAQQPAQPQQTPGMQGG